MTLKKNFIYLILAAMLALTVRRAEAQVDCIPIIEGFARVTSVIASAKKEVMQIGLHLNVIPLGNPPTGFHTFDVLLQVEPGKVRYNQIRSALEYKRPLFISYSEMTCSREKFDRIVSIQVEGEDLTDLFLNNN